MKKILRTIALLVVAITVFALIFTACDTEKDSMHTVTFIADGKEIKTVETSGFEVIELPEAPAVDGCEFVGWYLDRWQWQKPFDGNGYATAALTSDIKVYAYYVEKKEEVSYDIIFYAFGEKVGALTSAGRTRSPTVGMRTGISPMPQIRYR